ncbi:phosphotransferase [Sulfurimonas sp. MAG313]|nr:phosphotransferase [Sulfurimonas sp. MAG313]MDF1882167.1 phosphotransferase [Sulfurimonas sp. MAG313]
MGVKTVISLDELNILFPSYGFKVLDSTSSGVVDTTYIISDSSNSYILKKYERDISSKINEDIKLLKELHSFGLNVPLCLDQNKGWFVYSKLKGSQPKHIKSYHVQALARFLAKLHKKTSKLSSEHNFVDSYKLPQLLRQIKSKHYSYYKRLQFLNDYNTLTDGLIHGDIFKDNTVFDKTKIGVFDFIDAGEGNFCFDAAVALIGFGIKNTYFINLFLLSYNQNAPKKLSKKELMQELTTASAFYALLRINNYKNTQKAKELL